MESDCDEEQDIESENEEDRAFFDHEVMNDEDPSFYRALNQVLGEATSVESEHPLFKLKVMNYEYELLF